MKNMTDEEIQRNVDTLMFHPCSLCEEKLTRNGIPLAQPVQQKKRQVQFKEREVPIFVIHNSNEFPRKPFDHRRFANQ